MCQRNQDGAYKTTRDLLKKIALNRIPKTFKFVF